MRYGQTVPNVVVISIIRTEMSPFPENSKTIMNESIGPWYASFQFGVIYYDGFSFEHGPNEFASHIQTYTICLVPVRRTRLIRALIHLISTISKNYGSYTEF